MKEKKPINAAIGDRVRARREMLRLSREELAEKSGLSSRFISNVENGDGGLSTTTLDIMARALDVSCDYLLRGDLTIQLNSDLAALFREVKLDEDKETFSELLSLLLRMYKNHIDKNNQ